MQNNESEVKQQSEVSKPSVKELELAKRAFLSKKDIVVDDADVGTEPQEDNSEVTLPQEESEVEKVAKENGWVPENEFKGEKSNWKDAKTWMANKDLYDTIASQRRQLEAMEKTQKDFIELLKQEKSSEVETNLTSLKSKKIEAIKSADVDAVEAIEKRIRELEGTQKKFKPETKEEVPENLSKDIPQDAKDFYVRNSSWFNEDTEENEEKKQYAISIDAMYARRQPNISIADRLKLVEKKVFERFGGGKAILPNVSPAESKSASVPRGYLPRFDDLHPEVKKIINHFVRSAEFKLKNGQIKDKTLVPTREKFIKQFIESKVIDKNGNLIS